MPQLIALLTLVMLLAGPSSPRASEEGAAAILLDNEDLCLRVGGEAVRRETAAQAAAHALAQENLSIAEELIGELPVTAERTRRLADALDPQQRVCGDPTDRGTGESANLEPELRMAGKRLAVAVPVEGPRRHELLLRFLNRREQATYAALERLQENKHARVFPGALPVESTDEVSIVQRVVAEKARSAGQERVSKGPSTSALASQGGSMSRQVDPAASTTTGVDPDTDATQTWDPSPEEMAHRRRQKTSEFRGRLDSWRPAYRHEMRELSALRSTLARELEDRSLQHVRSLCARLTGAVNRIEYAVVLSAPELSVREFLDRMLASYAAAGRWCTSGRFAFAWIEIEKADQRWRQLSARLSMLDGG